MKYFITELQRKASESSCYFEFQKGKFKGKFWLADSICIDGTVFDSLDFPALFSAALPEFDYFGVTTVTPTQYERLRATVLEHGGSAADAMAELDIWVSGCYQTEAHFSILGI